MFFNLVCSTCFWRYALVLIAMYNLFDFMGRYIPLIESLKLTSRKKIMVAVLLRFCLIPVFYFTAKYGDQGWMIFITSILGLTNGYLTICVFTAAPTGYKVFNPPISSVAQNSPFHHWTNVLFYFVFWFAGAGAKCVGKHFGVFSSNRANCRSNIGLVVAHRKRLVNSPGSSFYSTIDRDSRWLASDNGGIID